MDVSTKVSRTPAPQEWLETWGSPLASLEENRTNDGSSPGGGTQGPLCGEGRPEFGAITKCPEVDDSDNSDGSSSPVFTTWGALCWAISVRGFVYFSSPFYDRVVHVYSVTQSCLDLCKLRGP